MTKKLYNFAALATVASSHGGRRLDGAVAPSQAAKPLTGRGQSFQTRPIRVDAEPGAEGPDSLAQDLPLKDPSSIPPKERPEHVFRNP